MVKAIILGILIVIAGYSETKEYGGSHYEGEYFEDTQRVNLICSSSKHEVAMAAQMIGAVPFYYDGRWCISTGDNSYETIEKMLGDVSVAILRAGVSIWSIFIHEGVQGADNITADICKQYNLLCDAEEKDSHVNDWEAHKNGDSFSNHGKRVNGHITHEDLVRSAAEAKLKCEKALLDSMLNFWCLEETPWEEGGVKYE